MAARTTAALIDPIRIVRRKGLTIRRLRRDFRFELQRWRWWLLLDRRIRRRWYVRAVCEGIVYRSKLGKLEPPIGFAVGRHCLCPGLIQAANCPVRRFREGNGKEVNTQQQSASTLGLAVLGSCFDVISYLGEFVIATEACWDRPAERWSLLY